MFVAIQWTTQEQAKSLPFIASERLSHGAVRTGWNQAILGDFRNKFSN
jgi:hypothetical protein